MIANELDHVKKQINLFRSQSECNYIFACQAAVPVILTPELLYHLWNNFKSYNYIDEPHNQYKVSHFAVLDILLAPFCRQVGYETFEFLKEARDVLLTELEMDLGVRRKYSIAQFLDSYSLTELVNLKDNSIRDIHLLTSKAFLRPLDFEKEIVMKLNETIDDAGKFQILKLYHKLLPSGHDTDLYKIANEVVKGGVEQLNPILIREINFKSPDVLNVEVSLPMSVSAKVNIEHISEIDSRIPKSSRGRKTKILYIDDEENNLIGFKATFRLDYDVLVAISGQAAIKILEDNEDIKVIFCDEKMPGMTGVQFFEKILIVYPKPVRILITGYMEVENVINSINKAHIYRFLTKPTDHMEVRSAIEEAIEYYTANVMLIVRNGELKRALDQLDEVVDSLRWPLSNTLRSMRTAARSTHKSSIQKELVKIEGNLSDLNSYMESINWYYGILNHERKIDTVNFYNVLKEIDSLYSKSAKESNVRFTIELHQGHEFKCEIILLKVIFSTLLSNAFKFQRLSEESRLVNLGVKVAGNFATITVSDNGQGMIGEDIDKLYESFYKVEYPRYENSTGLLNLNLAIKKLHGSIKIYSIVGQGTTFEIAIPGK